MDISDTGRADTGFAEIDIADEETEAHAFLLALGLEEFTISDFNLIEQDSAGFLFEFDGEINLPCIATCEKYPTLHLSLKHEKDQNHRVKFSRGLLA